ncbi:MAG: IPT/TIG domain-containing protein, partial [Bacteroidota bacterium]|nr:IPT/TIG domain-containing protein [Bacteroidota bacterium]
MKRKGTLLPVLLFTIAFVLIWSCGKDDDPKPMDTMPTIIDFNPASGPVGTQITIHGTHFSATPAENEVKFGNVAANVAIATSTKIIVTVPEGAITSKISVTVEGETVTSDSEFTVTTAITLDKSSLNLFTLDEAALTATVSEANLAITWSSDNENVAVVDENGNVTATGSGTANIKAAVDGDEATCTVTVNPNVYVAGYMTNSDKVSSAVYWKNGEEQAVALNANSSAARAIFVDGSDVYLTGSMANDDFLYLPIIWKNGNTEELASGLFNSFPSSMYINGQDVYVAGYIDSGTSTIATVWTNGGFEALTNGSTDSAALSVFVSESDVYVAGYVNNANDLPVATLWKNGVIQNLVGQLPVSIAQSVYVEGNDV